MLTPMFLLLEEIATEVKISEKQWREYRRYCARSVIVEVRYHSKYMIMVDETSTMGISGWIG